MAAAKFGAKTTAQEVVARFSAHVTGRTFLITGAAAGIGFETARALASLGADVTVAARSHAQAERAVTNIRRLLPDGHKADVSPLELDLSSIESVRKGAAAFMQGVPKLNVLINNAGVMASPYSTTKDGLEQQFGVNHVGHHLLTELLMPALIAAGTPFLPSRVVNVSSMANYLFCDFERPLQLATIHPTKPEEYKQWTRYGETKLMNIVHAAELNRRCAEAKLPVVAVSLHPGAITSTKLARYIGLGTALRCTRQMTSWWALYGGSVAVTHKTIAQGASTTLVCALDPAIQPGKYYHNCAVDKTWVHGLAYDYQLGKELWAFTEEVIKRVDPAGRK